MSRGSILREIAIEGGAVLRNPREHPTSDWNQPRRQTCPTDLPNFAVVLRVR